jgi:hypothetical protein
VTQHTDNRDPRISHARVDKAAVDTLGVAPMSGINPSPIVTEVVRFEDLPPGSRGTRRAIAGWSDGTESEALTWYADEILICEGDLIGKTREQLRSVHFRRETATGSSPSAYGGSSRTCKGGPTALAPSPKRTSTPL